MRQPDCGSVPVPGLEGARGCSVAHLRRHVRRPTLGLQPDITTKLVDPILRPSLTGSIEPVRSLSVSRPSRLRHRTRQRVRCHASDRGVRRRGGDATRVARDGLCDDRRLHYWTPSVPAPPDLVLEFRTKVGDGRPMGDRWGARLVTAAQVRVWTAGLERHVVSMVAEGLSKNAARVDSRHALSSAVTSETPGTRTVVLLVNP